MNFIKRVFRKFGYKLEKVNTTGAAHKKLKELHNTKTPPVIPKDKALAAIRSVGRNQNASAFTYYERPMKSTPIMEELENSWWNAHGNTIEKAWVFSDSVNESYRESYVSRASLFFKEEGKKNIILDLGCGSGWFGRMIIDKDLEYHGIDFSSTQIEIANSKKSAARYADHLNYYCSTDFKTINNLNTITGVIIHAFLHHLYWEELENLFNELIKVLPPGCKFFIVEPVYSESTTANNKKYDKSLDSFVAAYRWKIKQLKSQLIDESKYDIKTEIDLYKMEMESQTNGFFFSPKEVPFKIDEFKSFLSRYLQIKNYSCCGILNLETAQFIERIASGEAQKHYSDMLFPFVTGLDRLLLSNNYYESHPENYLFMAFECVLLEKIKAE